MPTTLRALCLWIVPQVSSPDAIIALLAMNLVRSFTEITMMLREDHSEFRSFPRSADAEEVAEKHRNAPARHCLVY